MRNLAFILLVVVPFISVSAQASEGVKFYKSLKVAGEQVELTGKHLFIDFYADWCAPCKEMDRNVYTDPEVVAYMNENFVSVKVNAETYGRALANTMGIQGFPTLVYINPEAEEVYRAVGFHDRKKLVDVSKRALMSKRQQNKFFKKNYKKYKTNPNFLMEYMEFAKLKEDYKKYDDLAEDYVALEGQLDSLEWMNFVLDNGSKYKSKLFNKVDQYQDDFTSKLGAMEVSWFYARVLVDEALVNEGLGGKQSYERKLKSLTRKHNAPENPFAYSLTVVDLLYNDPYFKGLKGMKEYYGAKLMHYYCGETDMEMVEKISNDFLMQKKTSKEALPSLSKCLKEKMKDHQTSTVYDLMAVVLYKLGRKEESYKHVEIATGLALKEGKEFKSKLRILKEMKYIK